VHNNIKQQVGLTTRERIELKQKKKAELNKKTLQLVETDSSNKKSMEQVAELFRAQSALELQIENLQQSVAAKYDRYFDEDCKKYISPTEKFDGTVIMHLAKRAVHTMELPLGTVFLTLLGGASIAVATNYVTKFQSGTRIPAVLHIICEQPPSTGKSSLLNLAINPYLESMIDHNNKIDSVNNQQAPSNRKGTLLPLGFEIISDGTTAALDDLIGQFDSGRIVIASAEQAALESLLPTSSSYSSNNALLLNGWMGEYIAGIRLTRQAFTGVVQSSVLVLSQVGSIQRILSASQQTGLAERAWLVCEPSFLGRRTHSNGYLISEDKVPFNLASRRCVERYSERVRIEAGTPIVETDLKQLECLYPSAEGYKTIQDKRKKIEPLLGELEKTGELTYSGWLGKLKAHTLKTATVLHVFDSLGNGREPTEIIPDELVIAALDLVLEIGRHMRGTIQQSGEAGDTAEVDAVLTLLRERPLTVEQAKQVLRKRHPFRVRTGSAYKAAGARINSMLNEGLIVMSERNVLKPL